MIDRRPLEGTVHNHLGQTMAMRATAMRSSMQMEKEMETRAIVTQQSKLSGQGLHKKEQHLQGLHKVQKKEQREQEKHRERQSEGEGLNSKTGHKALRRKLEQQQGQLSSFRPVVVAGIEVEVEVGVGTEAEEEQKWPRDWQTVIAKSPA